MNVQSYVPPRVWAGCWTCDVFGTRVGRWVDAVEADLVTPELLHGGPTDHDQIWGFELQGFPSDLRAMSMIEAKVWGDALTAVEEGLRPALLAWVETGFYRSKGNSCLPCPDEFRDRYLGEWPVFDVFAGQVIMDTGWLEGVPEEMLRFIDIDGWQREIARDHVTAPADGEGVYIYKAT
ncbi:MAG: hypothetical protein ACI38U_02250 [Corynebacterium sp.]|uniref:hypothetical protein n=1 Tax=Corynebacterium sp. TaxID=1720 RepID=UPI003F098A77